MKGTCVEGTIPKLFEGKMIVSKFNVFTKHLLTDIFEIHCYNPINYYFFSLT